MSESHIAGVDVRIGPQLRQRCSWCGAILNDYDLTRIAVALPSDAERCEWTVTTEMDDGPSSQRCVLERDHPPSTEHRFKSDGPAMWPIGAVVRQDGPMSTTVEMEQDDDGAYRLPDDCCGKLPAELTAWTTHQESGEGA